MRRVVRAKWRPPLMLVLGGSLLAVLFLPVVGLILVANFAPGLTSGQAIAWVGAGSLLVTLVLGWLLWRLILGPVRALGERAEIIRSGGRVEPMARYGTPEIGDLGEAVLGMADVLRARELAVRSYADHVSHELKTPLTAIRGAAELLAGDETLTPEAAGLVKTIVEAEARSEQLLEAARDIAAARSPVHHGETRLRDVALPDVGDVSVEVVGGDVRLPLSTEGLGVVLGHLILNAQAAGATRVKVTVEGGAAGAKLTVEDDGPGISDGNAARVFEPFFTTKRDEGGTGMGLAIVQTLLLAHGVAISIEPSETGARFEIVF